MDIGLTVSHLSYRHGRTTNAFIDPKRSELRLDFMNTTVVRLSTS